MARKQKLIHLHGAKTLTMAMAQNAGMAVGEIAIKNGSDTEGASELYVLTKDGQKVETFITSTAIDAKIKVVGDKVEALIGDDGSIAALKADLEGQIEAAEANANDYADTAVSTAVGAYKAEGVEASGLRKEIADAEDRAKKVATDALDTAKGYTDTVAGAYATETAEASGLRKEIADAEAAAKEYTDTIAGAYATETVEASGLRKEIADAEARVNATIGTVASGKTVVDMIDEAAKAGSDAAQAAADVETRINATIGTVASGKTVVDMIDEAESNANDYADTAVSTAVGAYATEGVEASGLRKEIAEAEDRAKGNTVEHENKTDIHITSQERENWNQAKKDIDDFFASDAKIEGTIDTLREIQEWLNNTDNKDASSIIQMIATETTQRQEGDKNITDNIIGTVASGTTVVEMIGEAESNAKGYADGLVMVDGVAKFDAAGSAEAVEERVNATIGTVASGKTVVDMIDEAAKAGSDAAGAAGQALIDAKAYADGLVKDEDGKVKFDAVGSAEAVEERVNATIGTVASGTTVVDMIEEAAKAGSDAAQAAADVETRVNATIGTVASGTTVVDMIEEAESNANDYADTAVSTAVGAYATEGVEASGLRKEIAEAEDRAKGHTNSAIEGLTTSVFGQNAYDASKHEGTNLKVTVVQTNGILESLTIDDSNLVIDCGTYDA